MRGSNRAFLVGTWHLSRPDWNTHPFLSSLLLWFIARRSSALTCHLQTAGVGTSPRRTNAGVPPQRRQTEFTRAEGILPSHRESSATQGAAQPCTWTQGLEGRAWLHCTGNENACRQQVLTCSPRLGKALPPLFFIQAKCLRLETRLSQRWPLFSHSARAHTTVGIQLERTYNKKNLSALNKNVTYLDYIRQKLVWTHPKAVREGDSLVAWAGLGSMFLPCLCRKHFPLAVTGHTCSKWGWLCLWLLMALGRMDVSSYTTENQVKMVLIFTLVVNGDFFQPSCLKAYLYISKDSV